MNKPNVLATATFLSSIILTIICIIVIGVQHNTIKDLKEHNQFLESDNIRLTDDLWVLHFKLQAENLDD